MTWTQSLSFCLDTSPQWIKSGLGSGDWLGHWRIFRFHDFQKLTLVIHLHCEAPSNGFVAFGWMGDSRCTHARINLLLLSIVIHKYQWVHSTGREAINVQVMTLCPPCLSHGVLWIMSCSSLIFLIRFSDTLQWCAGMHLQWRSWGQQCFQVTDRPGDPVRLSLHPSSNKPLVPS